MVLRILSKVDKFLFFCVLSMLVFGYSAHASPASSNQSSAPLYVDEIPTKPTADHSKFAVLKQNFKSGPEVTKACLSCHNEAGNQFSKTIHWTWKCPKDPEQKLGKAALSLNNFCISIPGNEPRCTSCHAGYGWKDKNFDFSKTENIDCLVCHEKTGTYKKFPSGAGHPVKKPKKFKGNKKMYYPPDWNKVAQSVAIPDRTNCGVCHFYGGGGDGVKHGDLDSSLFKPSKALDVHMGVDGQNFSCTRCHTTRNHSIAGRCYQTPASTHRKSLLENDTGSRITCESCHSDSPHNDEISKLNDHTDKVACQTCHIPTFARVNPTKLSWDWSTAGKKKNGKPYKIKGKYGKDEFFTKKGSFEWGKNVKPEYAWFDGVIRNVLVTDKIDPSKTVKVNFTDADHTTPNARIYPFKIHRASQPYDKVNQNLVFPKLFGKKGSGAYWAEYDWKKAIEKGMGAAGLKFSGEYDFVETEYRYPITHMVALKKNSLKCAECHTRENSRLESIEGVYMPGRNYNPVLSSIGWAGVILSLAAIVLHGLGRVFTRKNGNGKKG